jgi:predicted helicase
MERYAVSINKDSHIRNDPNEWCKENQQPRYILELIGRIVNVSIQTLDLIASLPPISFKNVAD